MNKSDHFCGGSQSTSRRLISSDVCAVSLCRSVTWADSKNAGEPVILMTGSLCLSGTLLKTPQSTTTRCEWAQNQLQLPLNSLSCTPANRYYVSIVSLQLQRKTSGAPVRPRLHSWHWLKAAEERAVPFLWWPDGEETNNGGEGAGGVSDAARSSSPTPDSSLSK